jgi:hypothetical protein
MGGGRAKFPFSRNGLVEPKRGADQNRTGVRGFAGLCLTTRPRRRAAIVAASVTASPLPPLYLRQLTNRRPECTSAAVSSRSSSSCCSSSGSSRNAFRAPHKGARRVSGRPRAALPFEHDQRRDSSCGRALHPLRRADGVAPPDLAVPALPTQARLLRGRRRRRLWESLTIRLVSSEARRAARSRRRSASRRRG